MDLRQLRAFAAVIESGSISGAAQQLRCAQPSVTMQVKQLETEFGLALLIRQPRGVEPTTAGARFYEACVEILAQAEHARQIMMTWSDDYSGTITAGIIPTLAKGVLAKFLPGFAETYPNLRVRIVEAYSGTLVDQVLSGELDFAVALDPRSDRSLALEKIGSDTMTLISGRDSGMKPGRAVTLAKLPPLKLVMPSRSHSLRTAVEQLAERGEIKIDRMVEIDGLYGTLQLLRNADWSALLPSTTVADEISDKRLIVSPIAAPVIAFDYYLIWPKRSPLTPAMREFLNSLREVLVRYQSPKK
ncbi:MAG: LysR family transcriptional regulator [Pseudomonadota bacterium]